MLGVLSSYRHRLKDVSRLDGVTDRGNALALSRIVGTQAPEATGSQALGGGLRQPSGG